VGDAASAACIRGVTDAPVERRVAARAGVDADGSAKMLSWTDAPRLLKKAESESGVGWACGGTDAGCGAARKAEVRPGGARARGGLVTEWERALMAEEKANSGSGMAAGT
jgi:hypothetical protein